MNQKARRRRPKRIAIPGGLDMLSRRYAVALTPHHYEMLTALGYRMDIRNRRPRCFRGKALALLVTWALEGLEDRFFQDAMPLVDIDQMRFEADR